MAHLKKMGGAMGGAGSMPEYKRRRAFALHFSIALTMPIKLCTVLLASWCLVQAYAQDPSRESDVYLESSLRECTKSQGVFSCLKFRVAKFFATYVKNGFGHDVTLDTPVDEMPRWLGIRAAVVRTESSQEPDQQARVFSDVEESPGDGELERISKFLYRQVNSFLGTHSIVVPLAADEDEGRAESYSPRIINLEDQRKEKKADLREARGGSGGQKKMMAYLIPLLALFKLKALMIPTLISVLIIKKILVLLMIALPYFLHMIKLCKQPQLEHVSTSYHAVPWVHGHGHGHGHDHHGWGGHDDYSSGGGGATGSGHHGSSAAGGYGPSGGGFSRRAVRYQYRK